MVDFTGSYKIHTKYLLRRQHGVKPQHRRHHDITLSLEELESIMRNRQNHYLKFLSHLNFEIVCSETLFDLPVYCKTKEYFTLSLAICVYQKI